MLLSDRGTAAPSCSRCGTEAPSVCGGCRAVRFCSRSCQVAAWPSHKSLCSGRHRGHRSRGVAGSSLPAVPRVPNASGGALGSCAASPLSGKGIGHGWLGLVNMDAFPGEDAARIPIQKGNLEAEKECLQKGCGGFVACRGAAYLRAKSAKVLASRACRVFGSTLWLSGDALVQEAGETSYGLPAASPQAALDASSVEKRSQVSEAEMAARFKDSLPVVLQDAQRGWPAKAKWTFSWLAECFGDEEMLCSDRAPFFRHRDREHIRSVKLPLREFIRYTLGEPNALFTLQASAEGVFYANGWAPFAEHPELLGDVSDRLYCVPDTIPREGASAELNVSLTKVFIGPAGTVSRLHHDTYATHVWLSQIRGRKQFICYPPDDSENLHAQAEDECGGQTSDFDPSRPDWEAFPRATRARPYSVIVEEGETVVLPSRWWHWAKSLTPSVTLMRNFVNESNMAEYVRISRAVQEARASRQSRPHSKERC